MKKTKYQIPETSVQQIAQQLDISSRIVRNVIRSGLDYGLSVNACFVGARLALSLASGQAVPLTLADLADILGADESQIIQRLQGDGLEVPAALSQLFYRAFDEMILPLALRELDQVEPFDPDHDPLEGATLDDLLSNI